MMFARLEPELLFGAIDEEEGVGLNVVAVEKDVETGAGVGNGVGAVVGACAIFFFKDAIMSFWVHLLVNELLTTVSNAKSDCKR